MENAQNEISANVVPWNTEAAQMLKAAVPYCDIADIEAQVQNDGAKLFRVDAGARLVGYYVLRIDTLVNGNEGVIVAGAGHHPDFDLIASVVPAIERQFIGCVAIRVHTARAGLVKKLNRIGYQPQEFVMRKSL